MQLKSRVTKKDIEIMTNLIKQYGYWSEQVKQFNSLFTYPAMTRLQAKINYLR